MDAINERFERGAIYIGGALGTRMAYPQVVSTPRYGVRFNVSCLVPRERQVGTSHLE
jgi:hypothetical protein